MICVRSSRFRLLLAFLQRPLKAPPALPICCSTRSAATLPRDSAIEGERVSMQRIWSFAVLLLAAGGALATVFGSVCGIVHDPLHRPVPDIRVILKARASDYTQSALSDAAGQFQFDAVPLGEYTVTISDANFIAHQSCGSPANSGNARRLALQQPRHGD